MSKCAFCDSNLDGQSTFYEDGFLFCVYHGKRIASCLTRYRETKQNKKMNEPIKCTYCGHFAKLFFKDVFGRCFCAYDEHGNPKDCLAKFQDGDRKPHSTEKKPPKG